ncbi:MAG: acyltransferase, partial [Myxococcota bacterium]
HLNIHFGYTKTYLKTAIPKKLYPNLYWSGYYCVVIFFTISGFVITSSALNKWGTLSKVDVRHFYWLRFSRIVPMLVSLLLVLSVLHGLDVPGFVIDTSRASWSYATFATLTFHINMYEIWVGYLPANWDILWSISVEEFFYIFFPLVCVMLSGRRYAAWLLVIFLILSPWARTSLFADNELGDRNHLAYLDSIAMGCLAAVWARQTSIVGHRKRLLQVVGWALVVTVFCFRSTLYRYGLVSLGLNVSMLSLGIAMIIWSMHQDRALPGHWLFAPLHGLRRMGTYSYEVYLTHMFVVILGRKLYVAAQLDERWLVPYSLVLVGLSYLLGRAVFEWYSEPLNRWLRAKWSVARA